jgi:hypothetical protein
MRPFFWDEKSDFENRFAAMVGRLRLWRAGVRTPAPHIAPSARNIGSGWIANKKSPASRPGFEYSR